MANGGYFAIGGLTPGSVILVVGNAGVAGKQVSIIIMAMYTMMSVPFYRDP